MIDDLSFDPAYEEWLHESTHALCAVPPKRSVAETKALIDRVLGVAPGTPWQIHETAEMKITVVRAAQNEAEYDYLGNFSATPPWFSVDMRCDKCRVRWTGCWDNFECPKCGEGELHDTAQYLDVERLP